MHRVVDCSMNRVEDCTPLIFSVSTSSCLLQVRLQVADGCCSLSRADDGRRLQVADGCCSLSRADDGRPQNVEEFGCDFHLHLLLLLLSNVLWRAGFSPPPFLGLLSILAVLFALAVFLVFSSSFVPRCLCPCHCFLDDWLCLICRGRHHV